MRSDLANLGTPIGPNDLMIAAIALINKLTLVSANTTEFGRVAGLSLENAIYTVGDLQQVAEVETIILFISFAQSLVGMAR